MKDTLVFDLTDLQYEAFKVYEAEVQASELALTFEDAEFILPLACTIRLFRQDANNIYVTGEVTSNLVVECRRCLNQFEMGIAATVELLFCPIEKKSQSKSGADKSLKSIEELFQSEERYYDSHTLELNEDVRQALVLEVPAWPLCSETCQGLCEQCGTQLNHESCSCDITEHVDTTSQPHASNPFSVLSPMLSESNHRDE